MRRPILLSAAAAAAAWAVAAPAAASAEQWRMIAYDDTTARGAAVAYADAETLARDGDDISFVIQIRFDGAPPEFDGLRGRMRIQCSTRRWASEGTAYYLGEQRGRDIPPTALQEVRPGTNGAVIVDNLCAGRFLTGPVEPGVHSRAVFGR